MEYIYRIHNKINNKDYVGLTNNPQRRKKRHFTDLRCQRHDNPHLQKAFNKYGEDNFLFEVLAEYDCSENEIKEYEKEWIKKLNTYKNGYNCNPGGDLSYNQGKLSKEQVFEILTITDHMTNQGGKLSKIFDVSIRVICNVHKRICYNLYTSEYDSWSLEQKDSFFIMTKYKLNLQKQVNSKRRKYSWNEVFMIYIQRDYKLPFMLKTIMENFNMDSTTCSKIKNGQIYQDYFQDYKLLNLNDKNKILCSYIEKYNEEPFELLETPNVKTRAISSEASNI